MHIIYGNRDPDNMALQRRREKISDDNDLEFKLMNAKSVLEKNIRGYKSELVILNEASAKLSKETSEIRERIAKNSNDLKERIDHFVGVANESVDATLQQNLTDIVNQRHVLEEQIKHWDSDIKKCKNALKKTATGTNSEQLVSERKVLQMILDSVNTSVVKPDLNVVRTAFTEKGPDFKDERLEELVGHLDTKQEAVEDIRHDLFEITSFPCPMYEINAMVSAPDDRNVWTCMGTQLEIVNFRNDGTINKSIDIDFKTDDITLGPGGSILATSPDGHSVIQVDTKGLNIPKCVYSGDSYIHGINMSLDRSKIVVCATDKPNYSNVKPSETSIIELKHDFSFARKIKVKQFSGKVYRIAENVNNEYILTFPKEGCVISVDVSGAIKSAFSKQTGSPNKVIDRGRVASLKEFWPTGVACNTKGRLFVTDWLGKRVIILDSSCKYIRDIGTNFVNPNAVCVNPNLETIWIGDKERIHVWQT